MTGPEAWDEARKGYVPGSDGKRGAWLAAGRCESWPKEGVPNTEAIRWVFEWLGRPDVTPADAPSAGAWALLNTCRANPQNVWAFYTTVWAKMVKPASDEREKLVASTDKIEVLIEKLQKGLRE